MNDLNNLMKETCEMLKNVFGDRLEQIWLYGSYARGDFDSESDVDIMVLVDLPKDKLASYRRKVSDFSSELDLKYDVLLSIKLQDKETFQRFAEVLPFFKNIIRGGNVSYNNKQHLYLLLWSSRIQVLFLSEIFLFLKIYELAYSYNYNRNNYRNIAVPPAKLRHMTEVHSVPARK